MSSKLVRAVFARELKRLIRRRQDLVLPLIFFVIVVSLLGIGVGPDEQTFAAVAPAGVWIAVLLATTISLDSMFLADYQDGTLEQLVLSRAPLPLTVASKIAAHWVAAAGPQILIAIVTAVALGFAPNVVIALAATLLLGSPILTFTGAVASALAVGLRGGAVLLALITLPLYMPTLIFGTAAAHNAALGLPIDAELYFLAGLAILAMSLAPFAAAAALRVRVS